MKPVLNSVRVSCSNSLDENNFLSLLDVLKEYRDCIDQVAFFTSYFHPPMPLTMAKEHCEILADRMRRVRELGFSAGMNILDTLGHHPDCMERALKGPWPLMTNIEGKECPASYCMNSARYREEYIRPLYQLHCQAEPDFIWIDDDVRYGHFPIGYGCFCDGCISDFNQAFHHAFTRDTLRVELNEKRNLSLRHQWLSFQSQKITSLLAFIRQVVNECNDSITLGFMTGDRFFEGYDMSSWADALSEHGKYEIMWRPGGGAYTDEMFGELILKSAEIGRQTSNLPSYVTSVQSEIENFPYQLLKKSPRGTALEAMLHLSAGANGTAFNILPNVGIGETIEPIRSHFDAIRRVTPFMRTMSEALGRSKTLGIHNGWHPHSAASVPGTFTGGYVSERSMDTFDTKFVLYGREMFSFGLPESYSFEEASVFLLSGHSVDAFSHEEIMTMLSRGVYLDLTAVDLLNEKGYGEYIGFTSGERFEGDATEVYAPHALNEGLISKKRALATVFGEGDMAELIPQEGAEVLCYLSRQTAWTPWNYENETEDDVIASCSMGVFENKLGGRVCASSYYSFSGLSDTQKTEQLKRIFRYLSKENLPAYLQSYARVRVHARQIDDGVGVTLCNMNHDLLEGLSLWIKGEAASFCLTDERNIKQVLHSDCCTHGMSRITIPVLRPFEICLITPVGEKI